AGSRARPQRSSSPSRCPAAGGDPLGGDGAAPRELGGTVAPPSGGSGSAAGGASPATGPAGAGGGGRKPANSTAGDRIGRGASPSRGGGGSFSAAPGSGPGPGGSGGSGSSDRGRVASSPPSSRREMATAGTPAEPVAGAGRVPGLSLGGRGGPHPWGSGS